MKTKGLNIRLGLRTSNALGKHAKSKGWSKAFAAADLIKEALIKEGALKRK